VNDISFSAQRAAATSRPDTDPAEARFRALVQSPLRAGLVRFLNAQPSEAFDVESLMATFGRMRLDVENCLKELVDFGVARRLADRPTHFAAARPERAGIANQLDAFLERRAAVMRPNLLSDLAHRPTPFVRKTVARRPRASSFTE